MSAIIGAATMLIYLLVFRLYYGAPAHAHYPIILVDSRGLYITYDGRNVAYLGSLRDKRGQAVFRPEFVEWQGNLVYWSDTDKSLAIVHKDGLVRWIEVGEHLPPRVERVAVTTRGDAIFLNLYSRTFIRHHVGVLKVLPNSGQVFPLHGVLEVRASPIGDYLALLDEDARVKVHLPSGMRNRDANFDIIDWDYDARNDCLLVLTEHGVQICWADSTLFARLPMFYLYRRIYARPKTREYWVVCHKPFHFGTVVLAYDYSGRFRGKVLEVGYECVGVIEPSPQMLQTIAKLQDTWRSPK